MERDLDVVIIGGAGRAGLPLGLAFADRGLRTMDLDRDAAAVATIERGEMPFRESGAPEVLRRVRREGRLTPRTHRLRLVRNMW